MKLAAILKEYDRTSKDIERLTVLAKKLYLAYFVTKENKIELNEIKFIAQKIFTPKYILNDTYVSSLKPDQHIITFQLANWDAIKITIDSRSLTISDVLDEALES